MEFSEIAFLKLNQVLPEMASFVVSFSDITDQTFEKEDGGLKVGVFIVRFGNKYYFIPVISKGETIQAIDSLFDPESQKFIPLTKNIFANLVNSSAKSMGRSTRIPSTVTVNPSLYHLVTPPRTGKFVYASESRMTDFLSSLPNMTKQAVLEKFTKDKGIYSALHKLFGLERLISALRPTIQNAPVTSVSPGVEVISEGKGLSPEEITSILTSGYAIRGSHALPRVAVIKQDFSDMGALKQLSVSDAGKQYTVYSKTAMSADAYLPKKIRYGADTPALLKERSGEEVLAIFVNGDYSLTAALTAKPEPSTTNSVINGFIDSNALAVPYQLEAGDTFTIFSPDWESIGIFRALNVTNSGAGTVIEACDLQSRTRGNIIISAYRGITKIQSGGSREIFVPYSAATLILGNNVSDQMDSNINSIMNRLDVITKQTLGASAEVGFDGVEYSFNGQPVTNKLELIKILVMKNGLEPGFAENLIKKASENRYVKFYMSKEADFEPAPIPQFGDRVPAQYEQQGLGPDFQNNLTSAIATQDSSTVESSIISELLQTQDMSDKIQEYLPDIDNAVDKLGRTLFLVRLNLGKLGDQYDASELLSFVSNLRNVYRVLGDSCLKLRQISLPGQFDAQGQA